MKTSDFDYTLPPELIAQSPADPRDHSRLMILGRSTGRIEHRRFYDVPGCLQDGDLLVFNDSRVFPARLYGYSPASGRPIELLLLARTGPREWRALVKPGRRLRRGARLIVCDADRRVETAGEVTAVEKSGSRLVRFDTEPDLRQIGHVPLPPYIHQQPPDIERYQTVYSNVEGSVAAPTAGLHFSHDLLDRLEARGVQKTFVTLHVGWDSFRPISTEDPAEHSMHSEQWELSAVAAAAINTAHKEQRRVISVGTTAVRLLENAALVNAESSQLVSAGSGSVDLFISPGFEFKVIDGMITNFHLPRSTLLMLVSAFAVREKVLSAYSEAVDRKYRFYSFGDAMLIA